MPIFSPREERSSFIFPSTLIHGENFSVDRGTYRPTFQELEQARGTKIVGVNQADYVVAARGEKGRIATFGLGGCTAVGVVATFPDSSRRAYVQHYDTFRKRMDGHAGSLEEMMLSKEAQDGDYHRAAKVHAVIMVPGSGIYMTPDDPAHTRWLSETLRRDFGEKTVIYTSPYSRDIKYGQSPYNTALVIDIPEHGSPCIFPGILRIQTEQ